MQDVLLHATHFCGSVRTALFGARAGQRWLFLRNRGWLGGDRITDQSILWICCGFALMGLALLANEKSGVLDVSSPARWPTAQGSIVSLQVEERHSAWGAEWVPHVTYYYSVAGRHMQGTRVSMAPLRWTSREDANRFLARYMGHDHLTVFYNPNDVSQSVLEPQSAILDATTCAGLVLITIGLCTLAIYARMR